MQAAMFGSIRTGAGDGDDAARVVGANTARCNEQPRKEGCRAALALRRTAYCYQS